MKNKMPMIKKGDKYNKLTAIEFSYRNNNCEQYWLFKCECGNEKIIRVRSIKIGNTKSCGCLMGKIKKHGMWGTRVYKSWTTMKNRCSSKNATGYKNWGGRGIIVCERWMKFENFYTDMGKRPKGKTLDRINNDKGYYKENCRWATRKEQSNNKRNNHFITFEGKTQTMKQWAEESNINYNTFFGRIKRGWNFKKALIQKNEK